MITNHAEHQHRKEIRGEYVVVACLPDATGAYMIGSFRRQPDGTMKNVSTISGIYARYFEDSWNRELEIRPEVR